MYIKYTKQSKNCDKYSVSVYQHVHQYVICKKKAWTEILFFWGEKRKSIKPQAMAFCPFPQVSSVSVSKQAVSDTTQSADKGQPCLMTNMM